MARGRGPGRGAVLTALTSTLIVVGAAAGATALAHLSTRALAGVLAFASAALLFLVTEELLVRAHENAETTIATTMFFVGFLALLLVGMASG